MQINLFISGVSPEKQNPTEETLPNIVKQKTILTEYKKLNAVVQQTFSQIVASTSMLKYQVH